MSQAKENILRKVRQALEVPIERPATEPDFSASLYRSTTQEPSVLFAETFIQHKGEFIYCETQSEFLKKLATFLRNRQLSQVFVWEPDLQALLQQGGIPFFFTDASLSAVEAGITFCECLVARTGSLIVSSKQLSGRRLGIYPPLHIVVAYTSQLVMDINDGLQLVEQKYGQAFPSMVSLVTGPSRTADIEKTLVLGAHGPKELVLFLIEE